MLKELLFPNLPGKSGNRGGIVAEIFEDLLVLGGILGIAYHKGNRAWLTKLLGGPDDVKG